MEEVKNSTILIVEDDRMLIEALEEKLHGDGFKTLRAYDGMQGLNTAFEKKPDIILLDIIMPNMSGLDMLEKLRNDPWGQNVPVIMLTNLDPNDEITAKLENASPSYYMIKAETSLEEIADKVKELLG